MVTSRVWPLIATGAALFASAVPARAQSPGLYYAWRALDGDVSTCIDRSVSALNNQELSNIQIEDNSVAGTTENATAVFVCLVNPDSVTVMIMVSSTNDDVAFELRENLKVAF